MATMQDIIDGARLKINETDPNNSHFTDTQLLAMSNEGVRYIYQNLKSIPREKVFITIPASGDCDVIDMSTTEGFIGIIDAVLYDGLPSGILPVDLNIMDYDAFSARHKIGGSDTAGQPNTLVRMTPTTYQLWPYPSSGFLGTQFQAVIKRFPAALSISDSPNLPGNMQDTLKSYVAWQCFAGKLNQYDKGLAEKKLIDEAIAMHLQVAEYQRTTLAAPADPKSVESVIYAARDIAGDRNQSDWAYSNGEMLALLNAGVRYIYQQVEALPRETVDHTIPSSGDKHIVKLFEKSLMNVMDAWIQRPDDSGEFVQLELLDYDAFSKTHTAFLEDTVGGLNVGEYDGDPTMLIRMTMDEYMLFPYPTDAYEGKLLKLIAKTFPNAVVSDEDEIPLPQNMVDILPHYIAFCMFNGKLQKKDLAINEKALLDLELKQFKNVSFKTRGGDPRMRWSTRQAQELN